MGVDDVALGLGPSVARDPGLDARSSRTFDTGGATGDDRDLARELLQDRGLAESTEVVGVVAGPVRERARLATAELFAAEGARVVVTGVTPDRLEAARQTLGERAEVVASDASSTADIEALVRHVQNTHGGVDVLFLNAGIAKYGLISALDEATLDESFRVNFKGPWLAIKHFAPHMRRGGSIVLNTSITHLLGKPYTSVYAASKAALRSLARTAAAELAPAGVRVNAVSPGVTDTPIHGKAGLEEAVRGAVAGIPLGRLGRPSDIARATLFLASDDSAFMTGEEIVVDGGMTRV